MILETNEKQSHLKINKNEKLEYERGKGKNKTKVLIKSLKCKLFIIYLFVQGCLWLCPDVTKQHSREQALQ